MSAQLFIVVCLVLFAVSPVLVRSGDSSMFLCDLFGSGTMSTLLPEGITSGMICSAPDDATACTQVGSTYIDCTGGIITGIKMGHLEVSGMVQGFRLTPLTALQSINFSGSSLITGTINVGDIAILQTYDVRNSGISTSFSANTNLQYLYCTGATLSTNDLNRFPNLVELVLSNSQSVTGNFPNLDMIQSIQVLDLSHTAITGSMSGELRSLVTLNVHHTDLSGSTTMFNNIVTSSVRALDLSETKVGATVTSTLLVSCNFTDSCVTEIGTRCSKSTTYMACPYRSNQCILTTACLACSVPTTQGNCMSTMGASGSYSCVWCEQTSTCIDPAYPRGCLPCATVLHNASGCVALRFTDNCEWCTSTQTCARRGSALALGCKSCQQLTSVGSCANAYADASTNCTWCDSTAMCIDGVNNPVNCLTEPETLPTGPLPATSIVYPPTITTQLAYEPSEVLSIVVTLPRIKDAYDRTSITPSFVSTEVVDPECWTVTQGSATHTATAAGTIADLIECGGTTMQTADDTYTLTWSVQLQWYEWVSVATTSEPRDTIAIQRIVTDQFTSVLTIDRTKDVTGSIVVTKSTLVYATYEQSTIHPSPGLPSTIVIKFATYTDNPSYRMSSDHWAVTSVAGNIANVSVPVNISCAGLVADTTLTGNLECWQVTAYQSAFACSTSAADGFILDGALGISGSSEVAPVTFHFSLTQGEQWCSVINLDTITGTTSFYDSALYTSHTTAFYLDGDLYVRIAWDSGSSFTISEVEMMAVTISGDALISGGELVYEPDDGQGGLTCTLVDVAGTCDAPNICYTFHVDPSLYSTAAAVPSIEISTQCRLSYDQFNQERSVGASGQVSRRSVAWVNLIAPYETPKTPGPSSSALAPIMSYIAVWISIIAAM